MRRSLEAENKALAERVTEIGEELRQMTEIQDAGRQRIRSLLVPLVSRIQTVCMVGRMSCYLGMCTRGEERGANPGKRCVT